MGWASCPACSLQRGDASVRGRRYPHPKIKTLTVWVHFFLKKSQAMQIKIIVFLWAGLGRKGRWAQMTSAVDAPLSPYKQTERSAHQSWDGLGDSSATPGWNRWNSAVSSSRLRRGARGLQAGIEGSRRFQVWKEGGVWLL